MAALPIAYAVASHNSAAGAAVNLGANLKRISTNAAYDLVEGDFVVCWLFHAGTAVRTLAQLTPKVNTSGGADWTNNISAVITANDTHDASGAAWYRFQNATPDTNIYMPGVQSGTTTSMCCIVLVFQGVDITTPLAGVTPTTSSNTNGAGPDPASITTPAAPTGCVVVGFGGQAQATGAALTAPTTTPYDATTRYTGFVNNTSGSSDSATGYGIKTGLAISTAFNASDFPGGTTAITDSAVSLTFILKPAPTILTATGVATSAPAIATSTLGQSHVLIAGGTATGSTLLADNFDDNSRDVTKWAVGVLGYSGVGTGSTIDEVNGRVEALVANQAGNSAIGWTSVNSFDLTNAGVFVNIQWSGNTNTNAQEDHFAFGQDVNNRYTWLINGDKQAYLQQRVAGGNTNLTNYTLGATEQWFRIRHQLSDDTIKFESAPSTASNPPQESDWVAKHSAARHASIGLTGKVGFGSGAWGAGTRDTVYFDNFAWSVPGGFETATAAAAIATATVAETHALSTTTVVTTGPALQTSSIAQAHTLTPTAFATSAPAFTAPTVTDVASAVNLTSTNLATSAPVLASAVVGQAHSLTALHVSTFAALIGELFPEPGFENGVPANTGYSDGGGANLNIIDGSAHGGAKHLRWDAVGSHARRFDDSPFVATGASARVSVWLKDSGIPGTWGAGGYPDQPHPLVLGATQTIPASGGVVWSGSGALTFEPAADSGWTEYTGTITGLTPGQTYYIAAIGNYYGGLRQLDIDDLSVSQVTLGQAHALAPASLVTAAPAIASAILAQAHLLASTGITTAAPVLQTPTFAGVVALSALSIATSSASLASATLAQTHALVATSLSTSAPVLAAPAFAGVVALSATSVATAAPDAASPTIGQAHALTAVSLSTDAPSIAAATFVEVVSLAAVAVATSTPQIETATAVIGVNLEATGLSTVAPALGPPTLGQAHALATSSIATTAPSLQTSTIAQGHVLAAPEIATTPPEIAVAAIAQTQALSALSVETSAPAFTAPTIAQTHALAAAPVATSAPAIATPSIAQSQLLAATNLSTAAADLSSPQVGQAHALSAASVSTASPALASATIAQGHILATTDVATAAAVLGLSTIGQAYAIAGLSVVTAAPDLSSASLIAIAALVSTSITTTPPALEPASIGQAHNLAAVGLATSPPQINTASATVVAVLSALSVETAAPSIEPPTLVRVVNLSLVEVATSAPFIASASVTIGQHHLLAALPIITSAAEIGSSSIGQQHHLSTGPIVTGPAEIGSPTAVGVITLTALPVETAPPEIGAPVALPLMPTPEDRETASVAGPPRVSASTATPLRESASPAPPSRASESAPTGARESASLPSPARQSFSTAANRDTASDEQVRESVSRPTEE